MTWEEAQQNPELMAAIEAVVQGEFYLDLIKRYQHNKPDVIAAYMMDLIEKSEAVAKIIRKFDEPNEALDLLDI